jgi:hypothetical protein
VLHNEIKFLPMAFSTFNEDYSLPIYMISVMFYDIHKTVNL